MLQVRAVAQERCNRRIRDSVRLVLRQGDVGCRAQSTGPERGPAVDELVRLIKEYSGDDGSSYVTGDHRGSARSGYCAMCVPGCGSENEVQEHLRAEQEG